MGLKSKSPSIPGFLTAVFAPAREDHKVRHVGSRFFQLLPSNVLLRDKMLSACVEDHTHTKDGVHCVLIGKLDERQVRAQCVSQPMSVITAANMIQVLQVKKDKARGEALTKRLRVVTVFFIKEAICHTHVDVLPDVKNIKNSF